MVDMLSTLAEKMLGTLGTRDHHLSPLGSPVRAARLQKPPPKPARTPAAHPRRSHGARNPREERGIARAGGLVEATKSQRLAGRQTAVPRLHPPPSMSPHPARCRERRIESRRQAGRMGACTACARWIGMMDGWSRASRAAGSTCTCCPPAESAISAAARKCTNP